MYRIQPNLFAGYDLYHEGKDGLVLVSTWPSLKLARQAKQRAEHKERARTAQQTLNLATFGCN